MTAVSELPPLIRDVDSHEQIPAYLWPEIYGEASRPYAEFFMQTHDADQVHGLGSRVERDDAPIPSGAMAWQRGAVAPGAFDLGRRVEVLDAAGISEQFIYSSGVGHLANVILGADVGIMRSIVGVDDAAMFMELTDELRELLSHEFGRMHNDWCMRVAELSPRLRPVPVIDTSDTTTALKEIQRCIDGGLRAISVAADIPPDGKSPGHPDLDPFYEFLAANDIPLIFHGGSDFGLFKDSAVWRDYGIEANKYGKSRSAELVFDPYSISILNAGAQNFVTTMIYGGVFERVPTLRVGCIEMSAYWVGPVAEHLRQTGGQFRRLTSHLSLTPEEYFQRNVRVSPFWWEPVDKYIERFGMEDVYVYGSDYPHFEGGSDPANNFAAKLDRFGPALMEKFFVKNAELLMPPTSGR